MDPVTGTESFPYHSYEKIIDYDYKDNTCTTYAIQKLIIFFFCIFSIVNERVNEYNWFCYWKSVDLDLKIIEDVD